MTAAPHQDLRCVRPGTPFVGRYSCRSESRETLPLAASVPMPAVRRDADLGPRLRHQIFRQHCGAVVGETLAIRGMRGGAHVAAEHALEALLGTVRAEPCVLEGQEAGQAVVNGPQPSTAAVLVARIPNPKSRRWQSRN